MVSLGDGSKGKNEWLVDTVGSSKTVDDNLPDYTAFDPKRQTSPSFCRGFAAFQDFGAYWSV
jgi:hypothetical protein